MNHYKELEQIYKRIKILNNASSILKWDSSVNLSVNSVASRSDQLTEINTIIYEIYTNPRTIELLHKVEDKQLDQWQLANFNLMKRWQLNATVIDNKLSSALVKSCSKSEMAWRKARLENNFKDFVPYLEEVLDLTREKADIKSKKLGCSPYESLADEFEPGFDKKNTDLIFSKLKVFLQNFIPEVLEHQKKCQVLDLAQYRIPKEKQLQLGKKCMKLMGFDFTRGGINVSTHPFCGGFANDTRITTRFDENNFINGLMGVIHETGHALYEQNMPNKWLNQPLGSYIGMQIHESQSLIFEMQIARSKEFLKYLIPNINQILGFNTKELNPDNFYRIINKVSPSFIRLEADEVTYPLHVVLRYEIENQLVNKELKVRDLPEIWRIKMQENLGITPKTDTEGVLQDIHWPSGFFGYFPSYCLGAMSAAQFYNTMDKQIIDLKKLLVSGKLKPITNWLKESIHNKGSLYSSSELLKEVTSEELNANIYQNYLRERFIINY